MPAQQQRKTTFDFLGLPAELRNNIYEYALTARAPITLTSQRYGYEQPMVWTAYIIEKGVVEGYGVDRMMGVNLAAGLLGVCKQLHAEAKAFLYQENKFVFRNLPAVHMFVDRIGDSRKHIKEIRVRWEPREDDHHDTYASAFARLPSLERLVLGMTTTRPGFQREMRLTNAVRLAKVVKAYLDRSGSATERREMLKTGVEFREEDVHRPHPLRVSRVQPWLEHKYDEWLRELLGEVLKDIGVLEAI